VLTGWRLSVSDTIGVIGATAAVVAAVYAFRADRFGRRESQRADNSRRSEIRPIIRLGPMQEVGGALQLSLLNAGGAATASWIALRVGTRVFTGNPALPPHTPVNVTVRLSLLGEVERSGDYVTQMIPSETLGVWVRDIDRNTWDAVLDKPWVGRLPWPITAQATVNWAHDRNPGALYGDRPGGDGLGPRISRVFGWAIMQLRHRRPAQTRPVTSAAQPVEPSPAASHESETPIDQG
jgi:hypothetical protein